MVGERHTPLQSEPTHKRQTLVELIRFIIVGTLAAGVHQGGAWALHAFADITPYWANLSGFLAALIASYLGHFYWTFQKTSGHERHLPRFLVIAWTGYCLSNVSIFVIADLIRWPFEIALAFNTVLLPVSSWLLNRFWAFKVHPSS